MRERSNDGRAPVKYLLNTKTFSCSAPMQSFANGADQFRIARLIESIDWKRITPR
jgi:hypothetical protein